MRHLAALLLHLGSFSLNQPLLFFQLQHPSHGHGLTTCSHTPLFTIRHVNDLISAVFFLYSSFFTQNLSEFALAGCREKSSRQPMKLLIHGLCGGISWANVGHMWRDTCTACLLLLCNMDAACKDGYCLCLSGFLSLSLLY